jgi:hypothetical protein
MTPEFLMVTDPLHEVDQFRPLEIAVREVAESGAGDG